MGGFFVCFWRVFVFGVFTLANSLKKKDKETSENRNKKAQKNNCAFIVCYRKKTFPRDSVTDVAICEKMHTIDLG